MKLKKKLMSAALALAMGASLITPAMATNKVLTIEEIAESTIETTIHTDDIGTTVTTYTNLQGFIETVHSLRPETSDEQLAECLTQYTGQDYASIPEDEHLNILQYNEVSTTSQILCIDSEGSTYAVDASNGVMPAWTSTDGYMEITTSYAKTGTNSKGENCFDVWATAKWLKFPLFQSKDAFSIGTTATFDEQRTEVGSVTKRYRCESCGRTGYEIFNVETGDQVDGILTLKYKNNVPWLNFGIGVPICPSCGGDGITVYTQLSAYLRYGVIASNSKNAQATYGHAKLSIGSISMSVSSGGTVSFGASAVGAVENYIARAITIS